MARKTGIEAAPIIGPWLGRIGQVRDIMATPCEIDPEVWVLAFFNGLPSVAASLYKPDPFDLITERFHRPHKRRRRRRVKDATLLLPIEAPGKGLAWAVFKVGKLAERLNWYMIVIDAGVELSYHWSSMAYIWSGCKTPDSVGASISINKDLYKVDNGATWGNWDVGEAKLPVTANNNGISVPAGLQGSISIRCTIGKPPEDKGPASRVTVRLIDTVGGQVFLPFDVDFSKGEKQFKADVHRNFNPLGPAHRYELIQDYADGNYTVDARMTYVGSLDIGLTHDP
jgi:hypothetical protein